MYHSNPTLFYIIVGAMVLLIIIINVSLFSMIKSKNAKKQSKLLKDAFSIAKSPWGEEEKQLNELSQLIEQIQKPSIQSTDNAAENEKEQ
jgi:ABC-type bacteriocin/lantibiotic exporter with double-glycine peptidase domain